MDRECYWDGAMLIDIHLRSHQNDDHHAWLSLEITVEGVDRLRADLDVNTAVAADPTSFIHTLEPLHARAIRDEIMTALVQARKLTGRPFAARLHRLGASVGNDRRPTAVKPIAYAVAALLAAIHGTGHRDLTADPMGGHGWQLESFAVS
jgi:hypothetical protein